MSSNVPRSLPGFSSMVWRKRFHVRRCSFRPPAASHTRSIRSAVRTSYDASLSAGVRVYEWQPSTLHATFVVDGEWSTVELNESLSVWQPDEEVVLSNGAT